jgi:CRP/FNR family cyclic AMP-dependent transcriptional regulator
MEAIGRIGKAATNKRVIFTAPANQASIGVAKTVVKYRISERAYSQGDPASHVMYIQTGAIKLSIVNEVGKEAVAAILGAGDFLGEGCLAGQLVRKATATAIASTTLFVIEKTEMIHALRTKRAFSDRFVAYVLSRNIRIEEDLVDQLFNSSEKRLARTLLLLARHGMVEQHQVRLPKVSQETLAEMIGATRSRVNFFMNKFKKLGLIKYNRGLQIKPSLLGVVLRE